MANRSWAMASSSASLADNRPAATPLIELRPEFANAKPMFITVARCVMSVCDEPEPTMAARCLMSVNESFPIAVV